MGKPNRVQEASDLLDAILVGDYKAYKTLQEMEDLLDEVLDEIDSLSISEKRISTSDMKKKMEKIKKKCVHIKDRKERQACIMKAVKQMNIKEGDDLLSEIENEIDNIPDQNIPELQRDVEADIAGTGSDEPEEVVADELPQIENILLKTTKRLIKEEEFRTYFKGMMKKWKITSPTQLDDEKKKQFFSAVDKGWNAKKE